MSDTPWIHWILVVGGEITYDCMSASEESVLLEARAWVEQCLSDRRLLPPCTVTDEDIRRFDVGAYSLPKEGQGPPRRLVLPFQEWVDSYYEEIIRENDRQESREYEFYLQLKEKWEYRDAPELP